MRLTCYQRLMLTIAGAIWLGAGTAALAKGKPGGGESPSCTDLAVTFSLEIEGPGAGIASDGNGLYEDGIDNVQAQVLICGTGDATLNTNVSSRVFWFDFSAFSNPLATNDETPDWASTNNYFPSKGFLNIRSLVNGICPYDPSQPPTETCTFTTTMGTSFTGPDRKDYGLRMVAEDADIGPRQDAAWVNLPDSTSKVKVTYYPSTDSGGERWEVESVANHVATLIKQAKRNTQVNAGQFSMPVLVTIRRQ